MDFYSDYTNVDFHCGKITLVLTKCKNIMRTPHQNFLQLTNYNLYVNQPESLVQVPFLR